jgi:hypothetical protein
MALLRHSVSQLRPAVHRSFAALSQSVRLSGEPPPKMGISSRAMSSKGYPRRRVTLALKRTSPSRAALVYPPISKGTK